ncbi:BACON domain-containing protein [Candidatus Viridilinea mediisalina]|uniref:BACON domain-containing protein n=1 Tax=Candidatus Viridilinea mediisalina TaxID=2024553 RepID=A0A2A6RPI2_9CHLR|nr:hypothetical protein [Candidatus Viridilinea mediisalina]PDW04778.1 hypothetical protein CJ255_01675 [Candidatus Viridilinea mediisalina]
MRNHPSARNIKQPLRLLLLIGVLLFTLLTPVQSQELEPSPQPTTLTTSQMTPFGMNTYFTGLERMRNDGDEGVARLIAHGRNIGVEWAREELSWGNIERSGKGRWDWNPFDRRLREAHEAGYQIIGMLLTTPAWARVEDCPERMARYASAGVHVHDYWCPPADPQDFADYVYKVVKRYNGDGEDDAPGSPRVAAWQIGNEPNAWETWPGTPAEYAELLEVGYAAIKRADPSAIVATGGLYVFDGSWNDGIGHRDGLSFLADALNARPTAWNSFDVLAIHPYMPTVAPDAPGIYGAISLWGRLSLARAWLDAQTAMRGGAPRPIWISEVGWSTCTADQPDCYVGPALLNQRATRHDWRLHLGPHAALNYTSHPTLAAARLAGFIGKTEDQQANYLVRTYALALAFGIEHINWFQLEDKFDGAAQNFWEEAAIFHNAAEGYAPKRAAFAYKTLTRELAGARFLGFGELHTFQHRPDDLNTAARFHLRFHTNENRIIELLWNNVGEESVRLPLKPSTTPDLVLRDGAIVAVPVESGSVRLTVSESPIYLRQNLIPVLQVTAPPLDFLADPNDVPRRARLVLANEGSGNLVWQAQSSAPWLHPIPITGHAHQSNLTVLVDPRRLPVGVYSATLHISSNGGNYDLQVNLRVIPKVSRIYLPLVSR